MTTKPRRPQADGAPSSHTALTSNGSCTLITNDAQHIKAVQWVRHAYQIPSPSPCRDTEISVADAARRLGCSPGVVYYWIETGQLPARRSAGNRLCIPWTPATEAGCRARIAASGHLNPDARRTRPRKTPRWPAEHPRMSVPSGII